MTSIMSRSILLGIFELLLQSKHLPVLVIHIFVVLSAGTPYTTCTCIGSNGSPSFDQK